MTLCFQKYFIGQNASRQCREIPTLTACFGRIPAPVIFPIIVFIKLDI